MGKFIDREEELNTLESEYRRECSCTVRKQATENKR